MKIKRILSTILILCGTTALIISYKLSNAEVEAQSVAAYVNEMEPLLDNTIKAQPISTIYYNVGEREVAGFFVCKLDIKEDEPEYEFTDEEIEILERITEAEATGADVESKKNIVSTVINRMATGGSFPSTIKGVVFQENQFAPINDGRYYEVKVTKKTKQAVEEVIQDGVTHDCLYFFSIKDIKSTKVKNWINNKLEYQFTDEAEHSFYTEK